MNVALDFTPLEQELEYFDREHRYYLRDREVPGVTKILEGAGLIDAQWFTEESRLRGQYVHLAAHAIDENDLGDFDARYGGFIQAYQRFLEVVKPTWYALERRVVDPHGMYAGRLDRLGAIALPQFGDRVLVDFKTGRIPPHAGIQTAAYKRCLPEPHTWKRAALELRKDGTFLLEPLTDRRDEGRFLAALELHHWKQEHLRVN